MGGVLASNGDCVNATVQRHKEYVKKRKEGLITGVSNFKAKTKRQKNLKKETECIFLVTIM